MCSSEDTRCKEMHYNIDCLLKQSSYLFPLTLNITTGFYHNSSDCRDLSYSVVPCGDVNAGVTSEHAK